MRTHGWALLGLLTAIAAPGCGSGDDKGGYQPSVGGASGAASDDDDATGGKGHATGGAQHGQAGESTEAGTAGTLGGGGANEPGGNASVGDAGDQSGPAAGAGNAAAGAGTGTAGSAGEPHSPVGLAGSSGAGGSTPIDPGQQGGAPAAAGQAGGAGVPSAPACHSNDDCADGEVCAEYGTDAAFHCTSAATSGSELGESCEAGSECEDQICIDQCTRLCEDSADCGEDSGFICVELGAEGYCMAQCATDAGCDEPQHCTLGPRRETQEYTWVCATFGGLRPIGEEPAGGSCSETAGCASGLCLTYGDGDAPSYACTGPCEDQEDCPIASDVPACGEVTLALADGGNQTVSACSPQ